MIKDKDILPGVTLYNADNEIVMHTLEDASIDVICIDPPYLYLKGQKLEQPFNELVFFGQCKRLLTNEGFLVMFGRGESFYRWNSILAEMGFVFKEEVVWDKSYGTSPLMNMSRVHETISIWTKKRGVINKSRIPYLEMKSHDIGAIVKDINRLKSCFGNTKSFDAVLNFLTNNDETGNRTNRVQKTNVSVQPSRLTNTDRSVAVMKNIQEGMNEKSIIRGYACEATQKAKTTSRDGVMERDRSEKVMQSIAFGMNEKSIIKEIRDHYSAIHPTQKPVRLLERLLALVIPKSKAASKTVVADFFAGSMSCMEAVYNMGMSGIAVEIDAEYYEAGKVRLIDLQPKQATFFN